MGRKRLWSIDRPHTNCDKRLVDELLRRYRPRAAAARIRIIKDFRVWARSQRLLLRDAAAPFCGSLLSAGLKIGSVNSYLGYVVEAHPELASDPATVSLLAAVRRAHADAKIREARRICWDDARHIFSVLRELQAPRLIQQAIHFMTMTGLRIADIARLKYNQVIIREHDSSSLGQQVSIFVRVKLAKNRKKASQAKTLRLRNIENLLGMKVTPELLALKQERLSLTEANVNPEGKELLFPALDAGSCNLWLQQASAKLWAGERPATSYSLRKLYMTTIIMRCNFDFKAALEYSLHTSEDTLAGFYDTLLF